MARLGDQTDGILRELLDVLRREARDSTDSGRVVQDLQIHQIELELQNRELREAQQALEESRDRYADLYDFAPVAYATVNRLGEIIQMNLTAAQLLGVERARGEGGFLGTRLSPGDGRAVLNSLERVLSTGEDESIEVSLGRAPANRRDLRLTIRRDNPRLTGAPPLSCRVILSDITDQLRSERALRDANRHKDEFLAMLGHELRNPLSPICHVAAVLALAPTPVQVAWAAELLGRQVKHLVRLVDDLLDVAQINRGTFALHRHCFDLREAVERAMEQALPLFEAHRQHLNSALPPVPVPVDGDPERLTQVIVNLLGNAAKFSAPNGTVFLSLDTANGAARLQVRDHGSGIDASLLPQVFAAFLQGEQSLDRPRGGLGLGLALVKGLVELHGGQVQAISPGLGAGSTFTVQLPLAQTVAAIPAPGPDRRIKPHVILVVDDDRDVATACATLLRRLDQQVETVHDGLAALEVVERLKPDLVLLDIGLPGMNGYEVARRLRTTETGRAARLVALTGYGQDEDRQRALAAGCDAFVCKPMDLTTLIGVLER
ncbi:PAS domain-containing sensor histidine kinase [uncultured Lamprocystis sp.]|jgi:signal transduction histidine kinase/CheY-like chemotaxis protein|uniref:hybrid sensor histidine kinase/response regulator n=1 Tax=uncultured Lamprocystis sp. TaxID=543132 RepID=UPI0026006ADB|nr:PAS domain-containing sensor histidine kinase [uncultured Lamprocystis sp.]